MRFGKKHELIFLPILGLCFCRIPLGCLPLGRLSGSKLWIPRVIPTSHYSCFGKLKILRGFLSETMEYCLKVNWSLKFFDNHCLTPETTLSPGLGLSNGVDRPGKLCEAVIRCCGENRQVGTIICLLLNLFYLTFVYSCKLRDRG